MKRWIKYVAVLVVAGFFLVGCKGDDNPHEPVNSKNKGEEVKVLEKNYRVNKNGMAIYNRYEEAIKLVQNGEYEEAYKVLENMGSEFTVNADENDVVDLINDVRTQAPPIDDLININKVYEDFDSEDRGYLPSAYHELTESYYENIYSHKPLDLRIKKVAKQLQAKYAKEIDKAAEKYDKKVKESISEEQAQATTESSAKVEVSVDSEGFYHMDDESYNTLRNKISDKIKRANGITDDSSQNDELVISSKEEAVAKVREVYGDSKEIVTVKVYVDNGDIQTE